MKPAKNLTLPSPLQKERSRFKPKLPAILKAGPGAVKPRFGQPTEAVADAEIVERLFPKTYGKPIVAFAKGKASRSLKKNAKVGVVLSGGQAPGGHNVIAGIFDALRKAGPKSRLFGFLGGPSGILDDKVKELTASVIEPYRNTGGFDMIQSGRTKIETPEQFARTRETIVDHQLDALVVIGGDDSNTNAALLAEYFAAERIPCSVVGVPKTIDGDLKNEHIEASFGFDTATKIYSELVGNICRDVSSSRKYWHFVRLMGRSASHITLEAGLKTSPNAVLVGEEVLAKKMKLADVVEQLVDLVARRAADGKNYGVVLVPEGLIEFIPEFKELIGALSDVLATNESTLSLLASFDEKKRVVLEKLSPPLAALLGSLPPGIQAQLMLNRDPHGNVQVSLIETEKLLVQMLEVRLAAKKKAGEYSGKFSAITHFFGYEGRCGAPSNFDANYCYALGFNAAVLALNGLSGYLSSVKKLMKPSAEWQCGGVPLTAMMNIERRKGHEKPVIRKALVELEGGPFRFLAENRDAWATSDSYVFPGPIQYYGPPSVTELTTLTLVHESKRK